MLISVTDAAYLRDYKVWLKFDDGSEGVVDLEDKAKRHGVFEPLNDIKYFRKLKFSSELGTIFWPNNADLAPSFLYNRLHGKA